MQVIEYTNGVRHELAKFSVVWLQSAGNALTGNIVERWLRVSTASPWDLSIKLGCSSVAKDPRVSDLQESLTKLDS